MKKHSVTYIFLTLWIGLLHLVTIFPAFSQYTEEEVKAAYLFNFAKFVKWPDPCFKNETSPFIIGVYGQTVFDKTLEKILAKKTLNNHPIIIKKYNSIKEIGECHILYISDSKKSELLEIIKVSQRYPTLTIGNNLVDFCESGGIINFTERGASKRFQINNKASKRINLTISSKLLALAQIIEDNIVQF